jgi:precorrin-2 C(20)-methyltransferase
MDEHAKMDPVILKQLFDLGLMGVETPEEYGGAGASFFTAIIGVEELSRVDPSVGVLMDVQNTLVNNAIIRWGSPEQKKKYLPRLAADTVGAYALSEAGSGSDAFAMQTKAVDRGDHYELTGQKLWITNGNEAGIFVVFANADPQQGYRGITAFIVEKNFEGFSVGKKENKLGIRASSTTEIILDGCKVPKENLLGEFGKGYKVSIETLNEGRIGIGAQMIGLARGALEHALRYTSEREQFGKAIGQFQAVQFQLAEMATDIEAARLLTYAAAARLDAGDDVVVLCEGDPLFYGSYMHLHVRLAPRFRTEIVAGVSGMSGCWSAIGAPIAQGDDVFSVIPGTLTQDELERRLSEADAAVVIKLGRNLPKVRRALERTGRLARAVYVERGTMSGERAIPLAAKADDCAPYFAVVLVPGWEGRS